MKHKKEEETKDQLTILQIAQALLNAGKKKVFCFKISNILGKDPENYIISPKWRVDKIVFEKFYQKRNRNDTALAVNLYSNRHLFRARSPERDMWNIDMKNKNYKDVNRVASPELKTVYFGFPNDMFVDKRKGLLKNELLFRKIDFILKSRRKKGTFSKGTNINIDL